MKNQNSSKQRMEENKVLTSAVGNAELFADTTDPMKLKEQLKKK